MQEHTFPTYFLSHGGGPWPFMKDQFGDRYDVLEASLQDIPRQIGARPKAVLVVTAHWEGPQFLVSASPQPGMIYDYSGFPPHTYQIQYPAPGAPALAAQVKQLLDTAGHPARLDHERGFDHGTFSALFPIYPQADVPLVQLSLKHGYDPLTHVEVGRALASLRRQGVLIVGSGLSYHNLRQFGQAGPPSPRSSSMPGCARRWPCRQNKGWSNCWPGTRRPVRARPIRRKTICCR